MVRSGNVNDGVEGANSIDAGRREPEGRQVLAYEMGFGNQLLGKAKLGQGEVDTKHMEGRGEVGGDGKARAAAGVEDCGALGGRMDKVPKKVELVGALETCVEVLVGNGVVAGTDNLGRIHWVQCSGA